MCTWAAVFCLSVSTVTRLLFENMNALLFLLGLSAFIYGAVHWWGVAVAAIQGGIILMALAVWPYVHRRKSG